jgi:hypothetical protein
VPHHAPDGSCADRTFARHRPAVEHRRHPLEVAMGILGRLLGPRSKYDKSLPYTYEARAAALFEVYLERETPIAARLFTDAEGEWLTKHALCRAFEQHYPGHIHEHSCSFEDRERDCIGP